MGPLQVCLNNVASVCRPPHATCPTLGTEEGSVHAQEQGSGYTTHSWKSCHVCQLTGHPSKPGCPESQSLPQGQRYIQTVGVKIYVHTLQNKTKAIKSTLCHTYALGCVGMKWSMVNLPVATLKRKLTLPPLRSYS